MGGPLLHAERWKCRMWRRIIFIFVRNDNLFANNEYERSSETFFLKMTMENCINLYLHSKLHKMTLLSRLKLLYIFMETNKSYPHKS